MPSRPSHASQPLPFAPATFDAILSNDAMCHIANRLQVLQDWHRVLRTGGRIVFTDAMIVTGLVSQEELAIRSSIGFYLFLPPGENERLIGRAGFTLLAADDRIEIHPEQIPSPDGSSRGALSRVRRNPSPEVTSQAASSARNSFMNAGSDAASSSRGQLLLAEFLELPDQGAFDECVLTLCSALVNRVPDGEHDRASKLVAGLLTRISGRGHTGNSTSRSGAGNFESSRRSGSGCPYSPSTSNSTTRLSIWSTRRIRWWFVSATSM